MPVVINEEWRDKNVDRSFPFDDLTTRMNDAGLRILDEVFIDAVLYPITPNGPCFISSIERGTDRVIVRISSENEENIATATVLDSSGSDVLELRDIYNIPAGVLVVGPTGLSVLRSWAVGVYEFSMSQTRFAAVVHQYGPAIAVKGFILPDGSAVTGDVWLVGENGVELWEQDGAIRIDVVGDPLRAIQECYDIDPAIAAQLINRVPLRSINWIGPDRYGDFQILAGGQLVPDGAQILRVNPIINGIRITGVSV